VATTDLGQVFSDSPAISGAAAVPAAVPARVRRVFPAALLLGWLTDLLFYGQRLGVSVPVYTLLLLAVYFVICRLEGIPLARRNVWLLAPVVFFGTMVCVRENPLLTALNVLALVGLLVLVAFFGVAGSVDRAGIFGYAAVLGLAAKHIIAQPAPGVAAVSRSAAARRSGLRIAAPVARGVVLALPVLVVFTVLLASADTIFAEYVQRTVQLDFLPEFPQLFPRLVLVLSAAWIVAGGFLWSLSRAPEAESFGTEAPAAPLPAQRVGPTEAVTVLALVDMLFASFVWVQFAYLFSGQAARTMGYEAYRLYARRGFGSTCAGSFSGSASSTSGSASRSGVGRTASPSARSWRRSATSSPSTRRIRMPMWPRSI